jgi:hypothetical protein
VVEEEAADARRRAAAAVDVDGDERGAADSLRTSLRRVKQLAEAVLRELSPTFDQMYGRTGRPSIPPERLLKASLLMAL